MILDREHVPTYEAHEFSAKSKDHVVIVIAWNEGERLKRQLDKMQSQISHADFIIVDGDSDDGSTEHEFLKSQNVRTLLVAKDRGLGRAIRAGLFYALEQGYEGIVTIDGNGKDDPESIGAVVDKLKEGYDMVQASRFAKGGVHERTPLWRLIGIYTVIVPLIAIGSRRLCYTDPTNGFKGLSRQSLLDPRVRPLRDVFVRFNMQFYLNIRIAQLGFKVTEVPATRVYPEDGTIPTKIHGIGAHLRIIKELLLAVCGAYNPKK
jgi:glycosyltransferase involved in cell wall biosynthesis